jgi:inorganic pyrophosphatase
MADLLRLPTFMDGDYFHVVVESPRGSRVKLKYDGTLGAMSISRPLALGISYPYDWGFVPSTRGPDGDPIDALVLWDVATFPGVVLRCRAIGVVQIEQKHPEHSDRRVRNDRVIAVPQEDRRASIDDVDALSSRVRDELAHFFIAAASLEGKDPRIVGWDGPAAALYLIQNAKM